MAEGVVSEPILPSGDQDRKGGFATLPRQHLNICRLPWSLATCFLFPFGSAILDLCPYESQEASSMVAAISRLASVKAEGAGGSFAKMNQDLISSLQP
jgi:hypothetical protein